RLLQLAPAASYHDLLVGDMVEMDLEQARGTFTALSYTWGLPDWSHNLLLEGYQFVIGANLDAALRRLRSETSTTTVWADAVCINQRDMEEKLHQIRSMANIYSDAGTVLLWLG
ncbi:hypothetical protein N658DRAFT_399013, partial [Parathielavia hyrcaniae]